MSEATRRGRALGFVAALLVVLAWAARAEAAYAYRMQITIDRTRIGTSTGATTLSNYPLLLDVSSPNLRLTTDGGHVAKAGGWDISFQGADTTTCGGTSTCTFNYEIESYASNTTTGRVIAWVNIPVLKTTADTANTVIYVKYGDATIAAATQNMNGTWNTNFKGVWHLNQTTSPQTDSTTTPSNATFNGTPTPANATGLIGSGISTTGTTGSGYLDYKSTKFNWLATDSFTYQGWFKTTDSYGPLFSQREGGTGFDADIDVTVGYNGGTVNTNNMSVLVRDDSGDAEYAEINGSTAVNDGVWHNFALTRSGGTVQLFVDGVLMGSSTGTGADGAITTAGTGNYQEIGREGLWIQSNYGTADQRFLAATFDEFRISNTLRSPEWIKTDYNTQGTPASTFSLGAEIAATCGDGTVIAGEACDDGNIASGDGCTGTCTVETGFSCVGTAPSVCSTVCGDGIVAGSEGCDDGGTTSGNGCSATCTVETGYHCSGAPSTCTLAMFSWYKTVTIDRTKVGTAAAPTTLSNYPVLFSVTDSALAVTGGHAISTSGYDIIFRGLDTVTCGGPSVCTLPHQIESYNPATGTIVAWINVAGLKTRTNTADTTFRVMYGNTAITTSTERVTSTWNQEFTGVWHLNQTPSGAASMSDATTNTGGTPNNVTALAGGKIGGGVSMNGTSSYISLNSGSALNASSDFTYSVWVNTSDTIGGIFTLRNSTNVDQAIQLMMGADVSRIQSGRLMAASRDDLGGGEADVVTGNGVFTTGVWHLVTMTRLADTIRLYLDATSIGTDTGASSGSITTNLRALGRDGRWVQDSYRSGTLSSNDYYLSGSLDEARASSVARSIDWVTTDYNNQNAPTTFLSLGAEVATNSATSVDLLSLDATATCAGTTIAWQMAQSFDTLGFNVFREVNGARVKLTDALVPAQAVSGGAGDRYSFVDAAAPQAGAVYLIENVTFALDSRWYGPAAPATVPDCRSIAVTGPSSAPVPTASPSGTAAESAGDQAGGCALAGAPHGRGPAAVVLAAALALAVLNRRRRGRQP